MVMAAKPATHADRIRARTTIDATRGNEGRTRYHGQPRRGAMPLVERDLADARLAERQIKRAIELLEAAKDERRPQFSRDEDYRIALGVIGNAGRAVDDIVLRPHTELFRRRPGAI